MLFLFLLGQGVWIYHVRELKVKEFKMRAGYLLSEVAEEYIADEGLKYLAYGRDSSFRNGRLRENKDEKCFPVNHFYVFSEDKIHLVYDDLYENRELDVRRLDSLLRNALTERSMPPLVCWAISDRNTGHILLTCGKVSGSDKLIQAVPANLGCGFQHHLIASFELPFVFNAFMGILLVEVIFLLGFILSLLWQWHHIHTFWKTSEVKMMGAAHLEHELKKPIAILLNAVEDLMESNKDILTAREQLKLKMMRVRLIKMADMTDTLLMICGNSMPQFKCADLNVRQEMDMVLELFEILKPYAKVSFHITPEAASACLDQVYFFYMVVNLVDNAIKYSGDHPCVTIDCWKENDNFVIAVRDNGIGIPKREQKRIFRAFYRMNTRCVRRTTGFGLGLTFVRKVVDTYGGDIQVESKVGVGSSFIVVLPQ